uniref:Brinker DNA-binding domain-containing protein n=1 Tax=Ditylenchus dipsaci TaxID=166011 RepID=A0A915D7F5_9BILA
MSDKIEQNDSDSESNSESQEESQESKSSRKRKAYSIEKKLEAVDYANKYSKSSASKKFGVGRTQIINWVNHEEKLRQEQKGSKRVTGAGRHLNFAELDVELARWVREQRAAKKKVSRRILKQQAIKMFVRDDDDEKEFKVGPYLCNSSGSRRYGIDHIYESPISRSIITD